MHKVARSFDVGRLQLGLLYLACVRTESQIRPRIPANALASTITWLIKEVTYGVVVCLDYKLGSKEILSPRS